MTVHVRLDTAPGAAQDQRGIGITGFITALSVAIILFLVQISLFLYLRSKADLSHIYNPKKNGDPPKASQLLQKVIKFPDNKLKVMEGSDAYYFLRYLKTLLKIFLPIFGVILPILIPLNYVEGRGQDIDPTSQESSTGTAWQVMGLDTLAFGNVRSSNYDRYTAHLVCALLVIVWFCYVSFAELREYVRKQCTKGSSSHRKLQNQHSLAQTFEPVARQVTEIDRLIRKRDDGLDKFESKTTALIKLEESESETAALIRLEKSSEHYGCLVRKLEQDIEQKLKSLRMEKMRKEKITVVDEAVKSEDISHLCTRHKEEGDQCGWCAVVDSSWRNILWSNVGLAWWEKGLRTLVVAIIVTAMIALWAIPVSWTAALSQLDNLIRNEELRSFFQGHPRLRALAVSVAGVLPGVALALMLMLIPPALEFLSRVQGARYKVQQAAFVQRFYFIFLFVQLFLVVSIASFFTSSFNQFLQNLETVHSSEKLLSLLSQNLPTAANYFFSYMILQALSGSSNIMMQKGPMFWFLADKLFSYTPRQKWLRGERMDIVSWGSLYPLYTTLACISLAYSVIAPLISLFAIISFAMLWLSHRYSVIYVRKLESDHGGVLYPRAINQTFTGIYLMELCLTGLFMGVRDDTGRQTCLPHTIAMLASLVVTAVFQVVLNLFLLPGYRKTFEPHNSADARFFEHVSVVANPRTAWLPRSKRESKFNDTTIPIDRNYPSVQTPADHWWQAILDKTGQVQIVKCPHVIEEVNLEQSKFNDTTIPINCSYPSVKASADHQGQEDLKLGRSCG